MNHLPEISSPQRTMQLPPKPKNPLSAYNIYFQLERKRILEGVDHLELPVTITDLQAVVFEHKNKGKRPHRKSHGKISFKMLARTIAQRWKGLDQETKDVLEEQAAVERTLYLEQIKEWKKIQESLTGCETLSFWNAQKEDSSKTKDKSHSENQDATCRDSLGQLILQNFGDSLELQSRNIPPAVSVTPTLARSRVTTNAWEANPDWSTSFSNNFNMEENEQSSFGMFDPIPFHPDHEMSRMTSSNGQGAASHSGLELFEIVDPWAEDDLF